MKINKGRLAVLSAVRDVSEEIRIFTYIISENDRKKESDSIQK